jgi:hypothetical protein
MSTKMLVWAVFLLASPIWGRNWKQYGIAKWDIDCDFEGHDYGSLSHYAGSLDCLNECVNDASCTHFTRRENGLCYRKQIIEQVERYIGGSVCGFIPGRSQQNPGP